MARPKSDIRRGAILAAATRVIAAQGLSATTASIGKEAGVSNGSLFTYFETKTELLNALYVALKQEMAVVALEDLPEEGSARDHLRHAWIRWVRWAADAPEKRRTLAQLDVSDDITPRSREIASRTMAGMALLVERSRADGPMRDVSLGFVATLMGAVADATIDFMIQEPANADAHAAAGFDALWRMVA